MSWAEEIQGISVGEKKIGPGHPCFIVAEIGSNHNRDFSTAKLLIDASKEAGVDAVKFQFYTPENIIPRHLKPEAYGWSRYQEPSALEVFKRHIATPAEWFPELSDYARARGLVAFAAVHDPEWAERAVAWGFPFLKTASMEITNLELMETLAAFGKPLIISTGMAQLEEIAQAIRTAHVAGARDLILFHCIANYPARVEELDLRRIATLRRAFNVLVGFSDHSPGYLGAVVAVALGACMVEKHITLNRNQVGPDHPFAMKPKEFSELVRNVRAAEAALGRGDLVAVRADETERRSSLRSVVAARDLCAGEKLELTDLTTKRPGTGIPPRYRKTLCGRELRRDVTADEPIQWSDLK